MLTILALLAGASALSVPAAPRAFAEIVPLKAAMLVKTWQGLLAEVDQKVGVVPELGSTSAGVMRFGPELERCTLCAKQFRMFYESTFGLATADKSDYPTAKRALVPSLTIAGTARGERCAVYASLASPATMTLVERGDDCWSILALTVNPTERSLPVIVAAELATLSELRAKAEAAGASLRLYADVPPTLCGTLSELGLRPLDCYAAGTDLEVDARWFACEEPAAV